MRRKDFQSNLRMRAIETFDGTCGLIESTDARDRNTGAKHHRPRKFSAAMIRSSRQKSARLTYSEQAAPLGDLDHGGKSRMQNMRAT